MQLTFANEPEDVRSNFVIGSGVGTTIENIISYVFGYFDLDYKKFIVDPSLMREKILLNYCF